MKTLREILDELPIEKQRVLIYANEHGISHSVEYEPGKFIGVNVNAEAPTQQTGKWCTYDK